MPLAQHLIRNLLRPPEAVTTANYLFRTKVWNEEYFWGGTDVMGEEWDTLIILDSCRYDIFKKEHDLPGELESRISRGSATLEFLRGNFADRDLHDTIYVSANPQIAQHQDTLNVSFHDVVSIWETAWDEEAQNVLPADMTAAARAALEEYPNKRLILHYNQPHGPFLGPTARDLAIGPNRKEDESLLEFAVDQFRHNLVSHDQWWQGYIETFEIVHRSIQDLLPDIDGKTVITSDHGNLMGELTSPIPIPYYGHPIGAREEAALKVPWHIHETGERREIIEEPPTTPTVEQSDAVEDRLRDLGYV